MRQIKLLPLILFPLLALVACQPDPVTPSARCGGLSSGSHPKAAIYQGIVNKYVRRGLPGIAVSIRDAQGEWTSAGGQADIAQRVPMELCHLGKIASITKMAVGVLTMQLVEEGKLRLDDPLTKWLPPQVTDRLANAGQMTLLHLLTHQTGLKDYNGDQRFYLDVINNPNKRWTQQDLLRYVYDEPALFRPGTRAAYSNINTVLVTMVIESATTRSHAVLLREKIFIPIGMHNTYYQGHDALPARSVAQGYFDLFEDDVLVNVSDYNFGFGNGAGGLVSNVLDMQLFIRALFVQKTLLTQASLDLMQQGYKDRDLPQEYGIGLIKQFIGYGPDVVAYGHSGGDIGYTALLQWIPAKNVSLAMFVNTGTSWGGSLGTVYSEFRWELLEAIVN